VASYPSLPMRKGSQEKWVDDLSADRAVNGSVRARAFFTAKKRTFIIRHLLNLTDRGTLETFYNANRLLVLTMTWPPDGVTYSCVFGRPPQYTHGSVLTEVEVELLQI